MHSPGYQHTAQDPSGLATPISGPTGLARDGKHTPRLNDAHSGDLLIFCHALGSNLVQVFQCTLQAVNTLHRIRRDWPHLYLGRLYSPGAANELLGGVMDAVVISYAFVMHFETILRRHVNAHSMSSTHCQGSGGTRHSYISHSQTHH